MTNCEECVYYEYDPETDTTYAKRIWTRRYGAVSAFR